MTFATLIAHAAEEGAHHGGNVQAETFWYGAVAFVVFIGRGQRSRAVLRSR